MLVELLADIRYVADVGLRGQRTKCNSMYFTIIDVSKILSRRPSRIPSKILSKIPPKILSKIPSRIPSKMPSKIPSRRPSNIPPNIPSIPDMTCNYQT